MRYKGEYAPSYLLDPEEYTWHPLEECRSLLEKYHYAAFAHPDRSTERRYAGQGTCIECGEHTVLRSHRMEVTQSPLPISLLDELRLLLANAEGEPTVIPLAVS